MSPNPIKSALCNSERSLPARLPDPLVGQQTVLANGLTVYVVESHEAPTVAAWLVVRAGAAQDTAQPGGPHQCRPVVSAVGVALQDDREGCSFLHATVRAASVSEENKDSQTNSELFTED